MTRAGTSHDPPRRQLAPRAKHEATLVHENNVQLVAHAKRVNGRAANEKQGNGPLVVTARPKQAAKPPQEARDDKCPHAPATKASARIELDPCPSLTAASTHSSHETTAARNLSTTKLLSCRTMTGSSNPTPAICTDEGHGL